MTSPDPHAQTLSDFITRNYESIKRLAKNFAKRWYLGSESDAEDLAHEVVLRILELSERRTLDFNSDDRFLAWLKAVLRNVGFERLRHQFRASGELIENALKDTGKNLDPLDQVVLKELVERLPEKYRMAVELRLNGLSVTEISNRMHITAGRVSQIIRAAINYINNMTSQ